MNGMTTPKSYIVEVAPETCVGADTESSILLAGKPLMSLSSVGLCQGCDANETKCDNPPKATHHSPFFSVLLPYIHRTVLLSWLQLARMMGHTAFIGCYCAGSHPDTCVLATNYMSQLPVC